MQGKIFKLKVLIIIFFSILFSASDIAYACKCVTPTTDVAFSRADAVFEGRVESVWPKLFPKTGLVWPTYKFHIFRVWKGIFQGNSTVLYLNETICPYIFTVGQTYLVYANRNYFEHLTSTICDRTKFANEAKEDFEFLGPAKFTSELAAPFIPESKLRRFSRHFMIYYLTGVMIIKEASILSELNELIIFRWNEFASYPFLLLHIVFLFILWILLFRYYQKKFPKIFWLFYFVFFFLRLEVFFGDNLLYWASS